MTDFTSEWIAEQRKIINDELPTEAATQAEYYYSYALDEIERLQSRVQEIEGNREHIEMLLCKAEKRIAELEKQNNEMDDNLKKDENDELARINIDITSSPFAGGRTLVEVVNQDCDHNNYLSYYEDEHYGKCLSCDHCGEVAFVFVKEEKQKKIETSLGLKSAQERQWISVDERLPEEDGYYIIAWQSTWGNGELYSIQDFFKKEDGFGDNVKYWQPLPQPPQESEE